MSIRAEADVVRVRQAARVRATELGFGLVDQTKIVTAASELARNTFDHGRGGEVLLETVERGGRVGLRLTFTDRGPGIPDVQRALEDGYTTGTGLGLGLGGARRLMGELEVRSSNGEGTRVTVTKWK